MTRRRRLGPTLIVVEACCRIGDTIQTVLRGRECPLCFERHRHLDAHLHVDHANGGI